MEIKTLAWDSEFFNKKVGEITIGEDADAIDVEDQYDVLYVKSDSDFKIFIEGFKCTFEETKVVFSKRLNEAYDQHDSHVFSESQADFSITEIYDLAYESGKFSRFKLDPNFGEEAFRKLYNTWVDHSLDKKFADDMLLYLENKKVTGFITYKANHNTATVGLIAVAPGSQSKGIGSKLLAETENRLAEKGITALRIPTQLANEAACSFYRKLGYDIAETTNIKHYWKI